MFGNLNAIREVEHPKDIVERFKRVDDSLDMMLVQYPVADGANANSVRHWCVIERWRESDKRRALIQRGDLPEKGDFDILFRVPLDTPEEQVFGMFEASIKGHLKDKRDVQHIVNRIHFFNKAAQEETLAPTKELAETLIQDVQSAATPKSFGGTVPSKKGK